MINKELIILGLEELSIKDLQYQLWVDGNADLMSSYEESISYIFDDSGLSRAIDSGYVNQNFSEPFRDKLQKLNAQVSKIPLNHKPEDLINHPEMQTLRVMAGELLVLLQHET